METSTIKNILGGIYKPSSTSIEPDSRITSWSIRRIPDLEDSTSVTDHIVGYNTRSNDGRVSSKIVAFDPKTMICVTRSGRRYLLQGDPGYDSDAEYVWNRWVSINNVNHGDVKIVTKDYLPKLET